MPVSSAGTGDAQSRSWSSKTRKHAGADEDTSPNENGSGGREHPSAACFLPMLAIVAVLNLNECASLPGQEPVQVTVAGIESLPGEDSKSGCW